MIVLELEKPDLFSLGWKGSIIIAILVWVVHSWERTVYLLDFTTFEPPKSWRITSDSLMEILHKQEPPFSEESLKFTEKILAQSGVGDGTAWPPSILNFNFKNLAMDETLEAARRESETVIFDCVRKLLKRTKTKAKDVDFLIINCSLFSPTPSLCSMVINEFGMRSDVGSYNLSGMVGAVWDPFISFHSLQELYSFLSIHVHRVALLV